MADCPKCRGRMTPGLTFLPDTGSRVKWLDGDALSVWKALGASVGIGSVELAGRRCSECGFVEFFANSKAKPVKSLSTVNEEAEELRRLVIKLQDRLAILETIATDPAERTAREIENLRHQPPGEEDPIDR